MLRHPHGVCMAIHNTRRPITLISWIVMGQVMIWKEDALLLLRNQAIYGGGCGRYLLRRPVVTVAITIALAILLSYF